MLEIRRARSQRAWPPASLALQQREIEVNTQYKIALIGRWYEPVNLLAYILVLYVAKIVIWDIMLQDLTGGSTDPTAAQSESGWGC
jgi:hypothetical protein